MRSGSSFTRSRAIAVGDPIFAQMRQKLHQLNKCSDSSETKHLIEFMVDHVSSIESDCRGENYEEATKKDILHEQLIGSLQEFEYAAKHLRQELTKELA